MDKEVSHVKSSLKLVHFKEEKRLENEQESLTMNHEPRGICFLKSDMFCVRFWTTIG